MKKSVLIAALFTLALISVAQGARAQGKPALGPDPATIHDSDLEKDSFHNLEVARQYFKLKKAYFAAFKRCEEIVDGNPNFAKIDEALYMAGMSGLYLSQNIGKQKIEKIPEQSRLTPEEYREKGRAFLSQLVNEHPDSSFARQAQEALRDLGGPAKSSSQ
ncbi:MAG TPA: outer membrane protein assembly factor BamD [Pyrinomonadaceae bacterium]|nr:outer membrane protein assembly factor BamD [Pyrinomonadaceae bacterium]